MLFLLLLLLLLLRAYGRPVFPKFGDFEAQVVGATKPNRLLFMLNKQDGNLLEALAKLIGVDFSGLPFLQMFANPASIGIMFSSRLLKNIPIEPVGKPLDDLTTAKKGISIIAKFRLTNCDGDIFCQFFKTILGDQEMTFTASEIRGRSVTISAKIPGAISFAGFSLKNIEAGLRLRGTPSFGLTNVELDVPTPDSQTLHFVGSLTVDPAQNADASLQMNGIYDKPLGFPFVAIGNLRARIRTNIACPLCVSALSLGGEIRVGRNCLGSGENDCIIGQGYFGVDSVEPENNFFYFSLNEFSYSKLLTAIGVPRFPGMQILDMTSVRGVQLSYSVSGATLPAGRVPNAVQVPAGLVLKGNMTFLWFVGVNVDIVVSTTLGVVTSARGSLSVDPVNIGPLLSFTSATDSSKGPSFTINVGISPPRFGVNLDGQFKIPALGVKVKAIGEINTKGFKISVSSPIFGIPATFNCSANFKKPGDPTSFQNARMSGSIGGDTAAKISDGVGAALRSVQNELNSKLNAAKAVLEKAEEVSKKLFGDRTAKETIKDGKLAAKDAAHEAFIKVDNQLKNACPSCDKVCGVPKPCIKKKCTCGVKYPCGWNSWCCKKTCIPYTTTCGTYCIPEPACSAARETCTAGRIVAALSYNRVKKRLETASKAFDVANSVFQEVANKVIKYNPTFVLARETVKAIQDLLDQLLDIIDPFPFVINRIGFDLEVGSLQKTGMSVTMEMRIAGRPQSLDVSLNLEDPASIAQSLARRYFNNAFSLLNQVPAIQSLASVASL